MEFKGLYLSLSHIHLCWKNPVYNNKDYFDMKYVYPTMLMGSLQICIVLVNLCDKLVYTCNEKPVSIPELGEINQFMDSLSDDLVVLWGLYHDDTIGEQVKVAVVATGFDKEREQKKDIEDKSEAIKRLWELYYPDHNASMQESPEPQEEAVNEEDPSEEILFSEGNETNTKWKQKGQSWLNHFVDFVKSTLEE